MRKRSLLLTFWFALMLAMPLQAFAVYAASDCPMGMSHMDMNMPQGDCEHCEASSCALMSFCQNLQAGLSARLPQWNDEAPGAVPRFFVSAFRSLILDPPERPPRRA